MNNIFEFAAYCLQHSDIEKKLQFTRQARQLNQQGKLEFNSRQSPLPISTTVFPDRPELRDPRTMPRRKFTTKQGTIAFFHSLAHIEFMAIYLAWDMIYRFRGMPAQFYQDWLQVADEEAQHFTLLRERLQQMGSDYGELPAHSGLWDVAEDSADELLVRLALVPRYMEAHGLDVTPTMIAKFEEIDDRQGVALLQRILNDEIGHVAFGSYWFNFVCSEQGYDSENTYIQMLSTRLKGKPNGKLNRELRKQAGFTETELNWLENC